MARPIVCRHDYEGYRQPGAKIETAAEAVGR